MKLNYFKFAFISLVIIIVITFSVQFSVIINEARYNTLKSNSSTFSHEFSPVIITTSANSINTSEFFYSFRNNSIITENECDKKYGYGLINNWKLNSNKTCVPDSNSGTSITCFHHADKSVENLCDVRNLILDVDKIIQIPDFENLEDPLIPGSLGGKCKLHDDLFTQERFGNGAQNFLFKSFKELASVKECDLWINKTLYIITRWDITNLFHAHEDMIHTFEAFILADLNPKDTLVVLADSNKMGPFITFWDHIMSSHNGPISDIDKTDRDAIPQLSNLATYVKSITPSNSQLKNICLKRAVFGVHAGVSPFSREIGLKSDCKPPFTNLFVSFKTFVLNQLEFINDEDLFQENLKNNRPIQISYTTRKGVLRHIQNEKTLIDEITKALCPQKISNCQFVIKVYDFQNMTFYQQIEAARNTDVLVGMHGAALTIAVYLSARSTLLEFSHITRYHNFHFANIASFIGVNYELLSGSDILSQHDISNAVERVKVNSERILKERQLKL